MKTEKYITFELAKAIHKIENEIEQPKEEKVFTGLDLGSKDGDMSCKTTVKNGFVVGMEFSEPKEESKKQYKCDECGCILGCCACSGHERNSGKFCSINCAKRFESKTRIRTPFTAETFPCDMVWIRRKSWCNKESYVSIRGVHDGLLRVSFADTEHLNEVNFIDVDKYEIASSIPDEEGNIVWLPFYQVTNK